MNIENFSRTVKKSQFVSEPEIMVELMQEAEGMIKAAWPNSDPSPESVLSMAKLILFYEDGCESEEEDFPESE